MTLKEEVLQCWRTNGKEVVDAIVCLIERREEAERERVSKLVKELFHESWVKRFYTPQVKMLPPGVYWVSGYKMPQHFSNSFKPVDGVGYVKINNPFEENPNG